MSAIGGRVLFSSQIRWSCDILAVHVITVAPRTKFGHASVVLRCIKIDLPIEI